ncbi:MAG: hypothetical protein QM741_18300 [Rudaea sp.]|uniref:hypothetical protein n=1 Tax=Rudaea sp. TaxID=2136325 RepID=UPI0039E50903
MLVRFSANHTHLYPGAILRRLDDTDESRLSPGDEVLVEFSEGVLASGQVLEADNDAVVLQMPTYRTQRRTDVAARTWRLVAAEEPGLMRVHRRLLSA